MWKSFLPPGTKPCYCCWERVPSSASGCRDNGCGRLWQGKGECVNATSIAFSKIEAEYDLRYSNAYYNKRCAPADSASDKDCCLCLRKKPCVDKGCIEKGGMCVDMKNARLSNPNYGPRSEVDLDSPLGDDLCANDPSTTVVGQNKQCCTCYKKKENWAIDHLGNCTFFTMTFFIIWLNWTLNEQL